MASEPPARALGGHVLLSPAGVRMCERLLRRALPMVSRTDGISVPRTWLAVIEELRVAMSACPVTDVRQTPVSGWCSVREVAELLEVGDRQARRLVQQLGGHREHGRWHIQRTEVEAEQQRRSHGMG
jgi:hypothetical protein